LRKISGPNKLSDGSWRIKTNEELEKLAKRKNLVREVKSRRIAWLGLTERVEEHWLSKEITETERKSKNEVGRRCKSRFKSYKNIS
jgi:hypothetical protein